MMGVTILKRISALSPTAFENLTFDCVKAVGLRNVTWRTPGADGGRDIEGEDFKRDLSGHDTVQRWYVECKLYSNSIDWPTVWKKVSYADVQGADFLLLVTNNNPSPTCETKINEWNALRRRPIIRVWRGYDLPHILRNFPQVTATHGLSDGGVEAQASLLPLILLTTNLGQSAYSASVFGSAGLELALEAVAALNELVSRRLDDLHKYGRPAFAADNDSLSDYEWLRISGELQKWEGVGLRAVLTFLRYIASCERVLVELRETDAVVRLKDQRNPIAGRALEELDTVAAWAGFQIAKLTETLEIRRTWGGGDGCERR